MKHTNNHNAAALLFFLLPTLFTHKLAAAATNGMKAEECPLLSHGDRGPSTWSWSFGCSVSLLAEAYLEVEGGRYHTAAARVIKPQATSTERKREWEPKTRLAECVGGFRQWAGEEEVRAEKLRD